jgi:hypothetical protein
MNTFIFWLDRPFNPRRFAKRVRRGARRVTIRYRGSFGRSAIKTLIVLALLVLMANVIGERSSLNLDANVVASQAGSAAARR